MSPAKRPLATPTPTTAAAAAAADQHKKRRRTSAEELKILEDAYRVNTLPSSEERQRLAERTGMTARAVQIWFQNKRQTEKRKMTQAMYPNVMIIPIHHPIDPSLSTPNKGDPNAAASTSATPQSPWTTYHPHRPSHAHPGAAGLAAPGMPYPGGAGYIVQPIAGRPEGAPGTGFYPVMPPGMVPYPPPPPGYALAPIAGDEQRPGAENDAQDPPQSGEEEERLRSVSDVNAEEKPKPSAHAVPAVHPGVPWQYYTPHPGYPPFSYGMPTPSTGATSAQVATVAGQQAPATPTPTPAQQGAAYPGYPPHPGQGYYAQPYGYPPYGYPPYPYAAAPSAPAQGSAPARETPAAADAVSSTAAQAAATTPTRGATPGHATAPVPTSSAARHPTTMGALGYTFASSSERENTGSAAGFSQPSKVPSQGSHEDEYEDAEGEGDEEAQPHHHHAHHGSSPSPNHAASESNERARHPPSSAGAQSSFPAESRSASRGDFHSRNSGEAARSGFRVTGETSALLGEKEGEVKREKGEGTVAVKIEDGEEVASETIKAAKKVPAVTVQQFDSAISAPDVQAVPQAAQPGKPQPFKAQVAIQRPRSSLGFAEPARRSTGSQRGILDEMCARRELPFRMIDSPDGRYERRRKMTGPSSSSPTGRNPASDSDPFGGSTVVIPARRLSVSKQSRAKRPSSASGLVIRRPARLPSRSPDIFDRMSSDPPSGGLEPSEDDEADVPLRIRRAQTEDITGLAGDLTDTDIEDDDRVGKRPLRLPSSTASDEYAAPSSTSTSRSLIVLATPDNKELDGAAVAPVTGHDQSSVLGGRKLRFVASDVLGGAGKKRKLELTEEDDKENADAMVTPAGGASLKSRKEARPSLGRMASLDYYAGSPAKRSCTLGAEARRLSQVVSKYQQKAPLGEAPVQPLARPRHALGELKANRKLNGSSSAVQLGKASRAGSGIKVPSDAPSVMRSLSVGNLDASTHRPAESPATARGRTEDEECARLLLGLGSSR